MRSRNELSIHIYKRVSLIFFLVGLWCREYLSGLQWLISSIIEGHVLLVGFVVTEFCCGCGQSAGLVIVANNLYVP